MNSQIVRNRRYPGEFRNVFSSAMTIAAFLCGLIAPVTSARAEPLNWQSSGLGNVNGARTRLAERGFTYTFAEDLIVSYNVNGGIEKGSAVGNRFVGFGNWARPLLW
jgi:hypothetical protein